MYPKDARIPPGEEWYYELDGRSHGPLSKAELDELLRGAGETASDIRVRQGPNGVWSPCQPASSNGSYQAVARPSQYLANEAVAHPSLAQVDGRPSGLARRPWDVAVACVALILFNVLFLAFWSQPYSRERRYLQELKEITAEVQELRAKPASDAEWHDLAERAKTTLAPMVIDLKKTASSSEPVRQRLLWSARDLVPRTIGPRTKERDEQDKRLKQYLESAQRDIESQ